MRHRFAATNCFGSKDLVHAWKPTPDNGYTAICIRCNEGVHTCTIDERSILDYSSYMLTKIRSKLGDGQTKWTDAVRSSWNEALRMVAAEKARSEHTSMKPYVPAMDVCVTERFDDCFEIEIRFASDELRWALEQEANRWLHVNRPASPDMMRNYLMECIARETRKSSIYFDHREGTWKLSYPGTPRPMINRVTVTCKACNQPFEAFEAQTDGKRFFLLWCSPCHDKKKAMESGAGIINSFRYVTKGQQSLPSIVTCDTGADWDDPS